MNTTTTTAPDQAHAISQSIEQVQGQLAAIDRIEAGFAALALAHPKDLAIDVTTAKGMREAVTARAAWRDPRIATEKARKAAKAPVLELGRAIDAKAAELTNRLLEGESNYDEQIKAEEARKEREREEKAQAEARRIATLQDRVNELRGAIPVCARATAAEILEHISDLVKVAVDAATFQEFQSTAEAAKAETLATLRRMHDDAQAREAEAARIAAEREELARLRADQEAREKTERERMAAEQRAEADRLAEQRRQLEEQQRAILAQQQRVEAEAAAARRKADEEAAATRRAADEQARLEREEQARQLAAERAEVQRQQAEQLRQAQAAERARADAEHARQVEADAARTRIRDAADVMRQALVAVRDAVDDETATLPADVRTVVDTALSAMGEVTIADLADVPF